MASRPKAARWEPPVQRLLEECFLFHPAMSASEMACPEMCFSLFRLTRRIDEKNTKNRVARSFARCVRRRGSNACDGGRRTGLGNDRQRFEQQPQSTVGTLDRASERVEAGAQVGRDDCRRRVCDTGGGGWSCILRR